MAALDTLSTCDRLTVNQLARREGVHSATIWRWILAGVRGVKLRSIRVGGRRFVLKSDWDDFSASLNADLGIALPAKATSTAATRAGHELDGLLGTRRSQAANA